MKTQDKGANEERDASTAEAARGAEAAGTSHRATVGVEEEFFVVDPATRSVVTDAQPVYDRLGERGLASNDGFGYDRELLRSMIEGRTAVCETLGQVRAQLKELRATLVQAAAEVGRWVVAAGTLPLADWRSQRVTPIARYEWLAEVYQQLVREQVVSGCHVHIGISDQEAAVQVLNRVRPWLPALLALSASSPYWMGADSGYASYRAVVWARWPSAGVPDSHRSLAEYRRMVQSLIDTGVIADAGQVYWDVRLSRKYETLEFRISDSCATVDEAVAQAGLCRGLVHVSLDEAAAGQPLPDIRPELLRAAKWRAARFGLGHSLIDVLAAETVPAAVLLDRLLVHLRPALEDQGDWDEVTALVEQIRQHGISADRQRQAFARSRRLEDVIDLLAAETASS